MTGRSIKIVSRMAHEIMLKGKITSLIYSVTVLLICFCACIHPKERRWAEDQLLGYSFTLQSAVEKEKLVFGADGTVSILSGGRCYDGTEHKCTGKLLRWRISENDHLILFNGNGKTIRDMALMGINGYYFTVSDNSKRKIYKRASPGFDREALNIKNIGIFLKEGLNNALDQCDAIMLNFKSPGHVTTSITLNKHDARFNEAIEFVRNTKQGHLNFKSKTAPSMQYEVTINIIKYKYSKDSGYTKFQYNYNLSTQDFAPEFIDLINSLGRLTLKAEGR